jgi:integrase
VEKDVGRLMKRKGRHPERALTAVSVRAAKASGRYADGGGLYLVVDPSGAKRWVLRTVVRGKRSDIGLGGLTWVSLAEAREQALQLRKIARFGGDPLAERRRSQGIPTFAEIANQLHESKRPEWRNDKHAAQWISTLQTYAFPKIGQRRVNEMDTEAVLSVLRPIWTEKPETASRVRQRLEAVLDYGAAIGKRQGDNPARWRGHLDHLLAKPSKVKAVEHHAALDWHQLPDFMAELRTRDGVGVKALAFTILTVARSGEVRGMRWSEVDLETGVWTVPGTRMKAGREHRVSLTTAALDLLGAPGQRGELVFSSAKRPGAPLSDMTLAAVLKRMGRADLTVHGFRSTFRDWAGETTNHPREVIEAALAHRLKDKAEASYARGDLFQKRQKLMQDWANFATGTSGARPRLHPFVGPEAEF